MTTNSESITAHRTNGFWSTQTLRARLGDIVIPYVDDSRTKQANTRLAMGSEYFVTQSAVGTDTARKSTVQLRHLESFCIPSGHFVFLLTAECIRMPNDAIGFLSIQTDVKFHGLVNISGFHVDPGSDGKIIFAVFNAGPDPVHIRQGDEIFRLWIAGLDAIDEEPRSQPSHDSIPSQVVNQISGNLESLQTLSKRLTSMDARLDLHRAIVTIYGGLFVALFVTLFVGVLLILLQSEVEFLGDETTGRTQTSQINEAYKLRATIDPNVSTD